MPYVFVLPNLLIFGIFILFPMLLNFVYAFTGGSAFLPGERPWVGTDNFGRLLACENYMIPNTCTEDLFWRAIFNTMQYVVFQVALMVLFSLITALVLNRKIKARGFFRSVFFLPGFAFPDCCGANLEVDSAGKWII